MQLDDYKPLRPGEIKILMALQKGSKSFTTLKKETKLQQNCLSEYLKRLQKIKVIVHDKATRRYEFIEVRTDTLFYNDVAEFLQQRIRVLTNKGENEADFVHLSLWTAMTDNGDMKHMLERLKNNSKVSLALSEIPAILEEYTEEYLLSTRDPSDRETIKKYKQLLLEYVKIFKLPSNQGLKESYALLLKLNRFKLEKRFPTCQISDLMVSIETADEFRKHRKAIQQLDDILLQPSNLEDIPRRINALKKNREYREILSDDERKRLAQISVLLEKPLNKRLYDNFNLDWKQKFSCSMPLVFWGMVTK
jgi:DNA-binding Lrp family transcriptional regulator